MKHRDTEAQRRREKIKKTERSIRLVRAPDQDGAGVFCVRDGDKLAFYTFREIPCDIGGRGFAVHRLGLGPLYHVRIGQPDQCECECMGYLRHGHCKHIAGLLALAAHQFL
jgi:hypothetical protein